MRETNISQKLVSPELKGMFNATIVFRCLTILQVFLLIAAGTEVAVSKSTNSILLLFAVFYTAALFILRDKIVFNSATKTWFFFTLLLLDLSFDFLLMAVGGGWRNSWYIYTFTTALLAAIFKKLPAALITATLLSLFYVASLAINGFTLKTFLAKDTLDQVISNVVSYFLAGGFFAYPAYLLEKLHKTRIELEAKAAALKDADELIKHFKTHSFNLKEALFSMLEPENFLKIVNRNRDIISENISLDDSGNNYGATGPSLTQKEKEVLTLITEGLTNHEIAEKTKLSIHTIDSHRRNIYQKLGVNSSAQAIVTALSYNLLD